MRILILVVLACFVFPASAGAVELVNPDGSTAEPYQTWVVYSRVPTIEERVVVYDPLDHCTFEGLRISYGCTGPDWLSITATSNVNRALFHLLGRMFEARLPRWKIRVYDRIVGDVYVDFAVAYRSCATMRSWRRASGFTKPRTFRRACKLIRQPN